MVILDRRSRAARWLDAAERGNASWLSPLGRLYGSGARALRRLRPPSDLPDRPLSIAVGNLRVGGTGKTPVVGSLGRELQDRGWVLRVVSRGYRAEAGGDEPGWLESELGIAPILSPDRRSGFDQAVGEGAQVVLFDDALQSRDRARLRLALVLDRDLRRAPRCLPAGPAREPEDLLADAHAILIRIETDPWPVDPLQRDGYERRAAELCGGRAYPFRLSPVELIDGQGDRLSLGEARLLGKVLLVSGLARPDSFERDVARAGLEAVTSLRLDDHAAFGQREATWIESAIGQYNPRVILCPEKNLRRLMGLELSLPLWALRSELQWSGAGPVGVLASFLEADHP